MKKNNQLDNKKLTTFKKKMADILETNFKNIELNKKISEYENFDSMKILEIINLFSVEKKDINPNKIDKKMKFSDLYKFYDK